MSSGVAYLGKTNAAILAGEMDLSEWDDEELLRGQRKSKDGRFHGRKPKVVPTAVHQELVKRRISRAGDILDETLEVACLLLAQVITDPKALYADRIKAAGMVMDRVMGKAPERVQLSMAPPWAVALEACIAQVGPLKVLSGSPNDVTDADIIDDDAYDD